MAAYSGLGPNVKAREMLWKVGATTNVTSFQTTIDATITRIVAGN